MALTECRLAVGAVAAATLNGSSSYLIENFPLQSDQNLLRAWTWFDDDLTPLPAYERRQLYMDGIYRVDGGLVGALGFRYMTEGQILYLDTLLVMSRSAPTTPTGVTFKMRAETGAYIIIHAYLTRPDFSQLERGERGVENVVYTYANGTIVT